MRLKPCNAEQPLPGLRLLHGLVADALVAGQIRVGDGRADAQASVSCVFDLGKRQARDVDQVSGRLDFDLHQVEQVGATGDELRAWLGDRPQGTGGIGGPFVAEGFHPALFPAASRMAATMLG
jgi:hypothetical protein